MSQIIYQNNSGEHLVFITAHETNNIGVIVSTKWTNDLQKARVFQSPISNAIYEALNEKVGGIIPWEVSIKIERCLL